MRKNVNIVLLFLIIAGVTAFTATTMYYQTTFKQLQSQHNERLIEYQVLTKELESQRLRLNETSSALELKEQKVGQYDVIYTNLTTEKGVLEEEKKQLSQDLDSTLAEVAKKAKELSDTKAKLTLTESQLVATKLNVTQLKSTIDDKNLEIEDLNEQVDDYQDQVAELQDQVDACGG